MTCRARGVLYTHFLVYWLDLGALGFEVRELFVLSQVPAPWVPTEESALGILFPLVPRVSYVKVNIHTLRSEDLGIKPVHQILIQ